MSTPVMAARVACDMDERTSRVKPALVGRKPVAAESTPQQPAPTGDGMVALSYMLSGILFYGGLGWAGAHYLGQTWMLPVGLVLGFVASMYLVIKRYSTTADLAPTGQQNKTSEKEQ